MGWLALLPALALLPDDGLAAPSVRPPAARAPAPETSGPSHAGQAGPHGHEGAEGLRLAPSSGESAPAGGRCEGGARRRRYEVAAVAVDLTVNRYLDHDPHGRMYVLEDQLPRVREEEARNAAARRGEGEAAVSLGLQGDAVQPLTLRVRPGECLSIRLRNALPGGEPASLHLHGAALVVAGTGRPAIATTPEATARPGKSVEYQWMVAGEEPEGTHYFHSHGDDRAQTVHGLFGAVVVEPRGSTWADPLTGGEAVGWAAMVRDPEGSDFREFVVYYHEIGDESFQLLAADGSLVPQVDPITSAYRPASRALNYRSEPFLNRLRLQQSTSGQVDKSLSYSSYAFGDPATPLLRSYVGDPAKQRVVHAGSETFHVHHVHGGSVRWRRQPGTEPSRFDVGLDKSGPVRPAASERIDSQGIGPSETFDVAGECGSGGCQQSVGDFMFHCHVSHHYFAGMWGIWRVYNTAQDGVTSTDDLPPLRELPDRGGEVAPAVTAAELKGREVDWSGARHTIEPDRVAAWVERQLPPPGVARGYDASVFDWQRQGEQYLGEPETPQAWPAYRPRAPGSRPPITFDPRTGKLAYPFLRPHLGRRPPFPPAHSPAPYLDPPREDEDVPDPGGSGPASLCPAGARVRRLDVNAITLPVTQNRRLNLVDGAGQLFVLRGQQDAARADSRLQVPLAVRANAGEHCVDVLLRSELEDSAVDPLSKVNLHIHFVQFDVQASDGVANGFNYEQSIRPFRAAGQRLAAPAVAGATELVLDGTERFQPGVMVGVGMDRDAAVELRRVVAVRGAALALDRPLEHAHGPGEVVSTEFARYRWYPDVQTGTAFFHEHVDPILTARHGLFGALVVEPPGSTYRDPRTGEEQHSGPVADVHTDAPLSVDVSGSFRELVLFVQDDNPLSRLGRSSGSAFNLRVEPPERRGRDPTMAFSTAAAGDPETPMVEANLGDPVVVRALVGGNNDVHTWHLDGHWFRAESWSGTSPPTSTVHLGISEREDLVIPGAGGPQQMPGDYLFYNGRTFKLREGSWGILRVHPDGEGGLQELPSRPSELRRSGVICPPDAATKHFAVSATEVPLPMLGGAPGKIYVLDDDLAQVRSGTKPPEPLVLRVNVGDCIRLQLSNTTASPVSVHADLLAFDPISSGGVAAGRNPAQAVPPGGARTYTYYAHPDVGETVAMLRDWGDVLTNPGLGLYGAIVVGPRGARYRDPVTGADVGDRSTWRADVIPSRDLPYRDFTLFLQDEDEGIGTHRMPYSAAVRGPVGINYRAEPRSERLAAEPDTAKAFSTTAHGDPATPVLEAVAGEPVRIRVLSPWSEQAQVFTVEGHRWPAERGRAGTSLVASVQVGALEAVTLDLEGGAGGTARLAGDYLYGNHREPYREAGQWGILRVHRRGSASSSGLRPLPCGPAGCGPSGSSGMLGPALFVVSLAALLAGGWMARRRSEYPSPTGGTSSGETT